MGRRVVGGPSGQGQGRTEECGHIRSKGRQGGIGVGCGAADGACVRKACMLNRERESAVRLRMPGRCCAEMVKLCVAAM